MSGLTDRLRQIAGDADSVLLSGEEVAAMLDVIDAAEGAWGTFPDSTQGREAHTELAAALVRFREVAG